MKSHQMLCINETVSELYYHSHMDIGLSWKSEMHTLNVLLILLPHSPPDY